MQNIQCEAAGTHRTATRQRYFNFFNFLNSEPLPMDRLVRLTCAAVEEVEMVEVVEVLGLRFCQPPAMSSPRFERALRAFKARGSLLGWRRFL